MLGLNSDKVLAGQDAGKIQDKQETGKSFRFSMFYLIIR